MNQEALDALQEVQALIDSLPPIPERIEVTPAMYQALQQYLLEELREEDRRAAAAWDPIKPLRTPALGIPILVVPDLPEPYRIIMPGQGSLEDVESP